MFPPIVGGLAWRARMSDQFSGVPSSPDPGGVAPLKPDLSAVLAVTLFAVLAAIAAALGKRYRERFITELALIADAWDRPSKAATRRDAVHRFLRPALAFLREGDG